MYQLKKLDFYSSLNWKEWRSNLRIVCTCSQSKYFNFTKEWNSNIQHALRKIKHSPCYPSMIPGVFFPGWILISEVFCCTTWLLLQLTFHKAWLQLHLAVWFFEPFDWRFSSVNKLELLRPCLKQKGNFLCILTFFSLQHKLKIK